MIDRNEIPGDIVNYLEYDETSRTGLRWKKLFGKKNQINVGDEAGSFDKCTSYYRTNFNNKSYLNHRIVFFLHNGYCPDILDHEDCIRTNNNINNLREASMSENNINKPIQKNNTTGVKGLSIIRNTCWRLRIRKDRKLIFLETYKLSDKTKDECRVILENKRKDLHGSFANHG